MVLSSGFAEVPGELTSELEVSLLKPAAGTLVHCIRIVFE